MTPQAMRKATRNGEYIYARARNTNTHEESVAYVYHSSGWYLLELDPQLVGQGVILMEWIFTEHGPRFRPIASEYSDIIVLF